MARSTTTIAVPHDQEQRLPMSYEEYLTWFDELRFGEWVDGEVIVFMPPSGLHQDLDWFLGSVLGLYVQALDLGTMRIAPFEMRLERSARIPDILFVAREHLDRLTPQRLLGPADLVVELISPHSATRDRREKFDEYQAAGMPEYWQFDTRPRRQGSFFYQLVDGIYRPMPLHAEGRYHSAVVPGFWLKPAWLWQDPLPNPLTCLFEIAPQVVRGAISSPTGE